MRVRLDLADSESVRPLHAIVLNGTCGRHAHGNEFATLHDVSLIDDRPIIGPGRCLTRDAVETALGKLLQRPQQREILPPHVLWFGDSRLCWFVPSARRPIFFKTSVPKWNAEMNGREVLHPPLVFLGRPGSLSVWALPSDSRPEGSTVLYQAPYYNIYGAGGMCNGNTQLPNVPAIVEIPRFERAFFETNFTHTNTQRLVSIEGGHDAYWRWMADPEATIEPEALLPLKLTLQQALNQ